MSSDEPDESALQREASRLLAEMDRLQDQISYPKDRQPTESERAEIDRLYMEVGQLAKAYSELWEYGPVQKYQCPCCGLLTLDASGFWGICLVCWWEDDRHQSEEPDYPGGPNHRSLNEAREAWRKSGVVGRSPRRSSASQ